MFSDELNIDTDFWSDPELKIIFKEEFEQKIPSQVMWAVMLYVHPLSKFSGFDLETKAILIRSDYLQDKDFNFEDYQSTLDKVKLYILTPAQRLLVVWDKKIQELERLLDENKITLENYSIISPIISNLAKTMKEYKEIYKLFLEEQQLATHGNVEESLSEKKKL